LTAEGEQGRFVADVPKAKGRRSLDSHKGLLIV
jgi:hypothetical protein